jgi:hypothetical protein
MSGLCCGDQRIGRFAGRVNDGQVSASILGGFQNLRQPGNLTGDNGGNIFVAPVAPIRGGCLWIKINYGDITARKGSGDRQAQSGRRFTVPAFLSNDG